MSSALPTEKPGSGALHDEGGAELGGTAALIQHVIGNGDDDEDISKACISDEDLGAVQHPVIAIFLGNGLLTLCIGTSARLGQAESTQPLAAAELRQVLSLLLGGCRSRKWEQRTGWCEQRR